VAVDLWAYGDESGIERRGPYCVVAGFVASLRWWNSLKPAWRSVIEDAKVGEFHANHFFGRGAAEASEKNEFAGWSDAKATKFLTDLLV